jgi:hypothetical protein
MDNRSWNILCCNIRGINSMVKSDASRNKIDECGYAIICLQETKWEIFDISFIRSFALNRFDQFDFIPSMGAPGGLLVLWNSALFTGSVLEKNPFNITISFTSTQNG